jgi:cytochrome P450 family 135
MASPSSIFAGDGSEHDAARARVAGAFAAETLGPRAQNMVRIAERHVAGWPRGRPFRILPRMRAIADEIFVREVLGVGDPSAFELAAAIGSLLWTPGNPPLTIPGPDQGALGRLVDHVYRRRRRRVAELLQTEIHKKRTAGDFGPGLLGLILADEPHRAPCELVEELLPLLMAAQEPMAAALTWLVLRAGGSEEAIDRLQSEGLESRYAQAYVKETLRLHPPAIASLRELAAPVALDGHELPVGATIMVAIPLLQRDPRYFPEPDRFLPERHFGNPGDSDALMPFGGGARSCLGEQLAHAEIAAVLSAIGRSLRLRPVGSQPERMVLRGTILVPQRSGLMLAA